MSNTTDLTGVLPPTSDVPQEHVWFDDGTRLDVRRTTHGGMGAVYIGDLVFPSGQRLEVAAKAIREHLLLNAGARIAFQNEIAVWTQLSGLPFVQPLLDVRQSHGFPYILTLAVEADEAGVVSLRDRLRHTGRLSEVELFETAFAVATAMATGVQRLPQLVHGDIKPDNILLPGGIPHLGDFGIAKAVRTDGVAGGTFAYLAPEAFSEAATPKSDIYAYGCTLYECIVGRTPFPDNPDRETMARQHREMDPPPITVQDPLTSAIAQLAMACLSKTPGLRPATFAEVAARVAALGLQHLPQRTGQLIDYVMMCNAQHVPDDIERRMGTLLASGDAASALRLGETVPSPNRSAELWLLLGSAYSLTNQDEEAIPRFDTCLGMTTDRELIVRCSSEKGLSLRRLHRYSEAIALFEHVLPLASEEMAYTVAGNLAATLLDAGRLDEAQRRSHWLIELDRSKSQSWLLAAQIERAMKHMDAALDAAQRAAALDTNSQLAHVEAAEILRDEFGDLEGALAHLDAAFATGEHDIRLTAALLSVNGLLGRTDDVQGLLKALDSLPEAIQEQINQRAMAGVKAFLERFAGKDRDRKRDAPTPAPESKAASDVKPPVVMETAIYLDKPDQNPLMGCRAYLTSEMFTIDYYDDLADAAVAARFGRYFPSFARQIVTQFGALQFRNSMLGVAVCQHCHCRLLSNRAPHEQLLCRCCEQKGPVVFDQSPSNSTLIAACEQQAQLTRQHVGGTRMLISLWLPAERVERARQLCAQRGWRLLEVSSPSRHVGTALATYIAKYYGSHANGDPTVQAVIDLPPDEERYHGTPWTVQWFILDLHSVVGRFPSTSMDLPEDMAAYITADDDEVTARLRAEFARDRDDPGALANLIELTARTDLMEARRLVDLSRQLSSANDPRLIAARGVFSMRTGDFVAAETSLLEAKRLLPLKASIRLALIELWKATGRTNEARTELAELRAVGVRFDRF